MKLFDLNPPPRVLVALTHTAMKPIDALCELIDNAIDSFSDDRGDSPGVNEIVIDLPTHTELQKNEGVIRVSDNGPGMTAENAEKALTAGYSSQDTYGRLGMFGMGLNIAAGKFARKTRLVTATKESENAVVVEVDLNKLVEQGHYRVQPCQEPKSAYFEGNSGSGTIIELTNWWRSGGPNSDNPRKLIQYGPGKIREILGRRYATLLRSNSSPRFKLFVKDVPCTPFEHCVWAEHRFVKRGSSQWPARQTFDEVLKTQNRCLECGVIADKGHCPVDPSHQVRSVEERVRGWVGVQRYDDAAHFGIDVIRNGRTIRNLEKDAFFNFVNDAGETIKDYPIDAIYGRIVGEVHLDHVRVDFTKGDFDRSTDEWKRAMDFLRGMSSLQPKQHGSSENNSPVMKIFRAYRRVRKIGLGDMYMGERQPGDEDAKRVSRETEQDFLRRFRNKEPGYFDDEKWWEKVEEASSDHDGHVEQCPECEYQNPVTAEICEACQCLLKSKDCIDCGKKIMQTAPTCQYCGKPQVPEGPWECRVCGCKNSPDSDECPKCGKTKGTVNAFDPDVLLANSSKDEDLSEQDVEIDLPNGGKSQKFDLETRNVSLHSGSLFLPVIVHTDFTERKLQIFIDKSNPLFLSLQLCPEHTVAAEAAALIRAETMEIMSGAHKYEHNLTVLQNKLLEKYWKENLSDDPVQVQRDMYSLLDDIRGKIAGSMRDIADEIFNDMSVSEKNAMVMNMQESNVEISEMGKLKEEGIFMLHIPPETVVSIFRNNPGRFFDKTVWNPPWDISSLPEENVRVAQKQLKETYLNCLEDGVGFLRYNNAPLVVVRRARLSIEFLQRNIAD